MSDIRIGRLPTTARLDSQPNEVEADGDDDGDSESRRRKRVGEGGGGRLMH